MEWFNHSKMFRRAKQNRTFEDIISQIQESILEEKLKPGDKLPSERDLREIFKVSRGTLREALRALEQKRLIQIKTGVNGGAFVCPVDTRQISESLELLLRYQKVSLGELAEFRETVEPLVAAKAAKKATKEDIRRLNILLETIERHLNVDEPKWDELIEDDTKFHICLAEIAGNRLFESVLRTVYDNINRYFDLFLPRDIGILRGIHRDFYDTKKSMEKRDYRKAGDIIQRHVKRFNLMMKKVGK